MNKAAFGAQKERILKLLPDDMDPEVVKGFFANTKNPIPALDTATEKAKADLSELARPFAARQEAEDEKVPSDQDAAAKGGWKTKGSDDDGGPPTGKGWKKDAQAEETPTETDATSGTDTSSGTDTTQDAPTTDTSGDGSTSDPTTGTSGDGTTSEPTTTPVEETASDPAPAEEPPTNTSGSNNYITDAADHVTGQDTPDGFNISIDFVGVWTATQQAAFIEGAETISDYVVGDLPDANGIDDMHITAVSKDVSGWAYGGPRSVHDSGLTKTGEVTFNSANLGTAENYGVIDDFAFHEILHAMGIGTHWGGGDLVDNTGGETRFTGQNAIDAYNDPDGIYANVAAGDEFSFLGVPLDSSADHLSESYFGSDVMTPTLSTNNVISDLSIAMLEDIGYDTIYGEEPVYDDLLLA